MCRRTAPLASRAAAASCAGPGTGHGSSSRIAAIAARSAAFGGSTRYPSRSHGVSTFEKLPTSTDASAVVERGECGQRRPEVAELAVVVVLDHDGADVARPGEQLQPGGDRQAPAERVLVARRDHDGVGRLRHPSQCLDHDPVGVDRPRAACGRRAARACAAPTGTRDARRRSPGRRPTSEASADATSASASLVPAVTTTSSAAHATPRAWRRWSATCSRSAATPNGGGDSDGMSSDAACRHAERHARVSMRAVDGRPGSRSMRGRAAASRSAVALDASRGREPGSPARRPRRFATRSRHPAVGPALGPVRGDRARMPALERRHAGRRALAHLEVALAGELLVRRDHRAAGDAELGRERPRRGHGVAGSQGSVEDAAPQPVDELHADRAGRRPGR